MTQLPLPESSMVAATSAANEKSEIEKAPESLRSPQSFLPGGPHGSVRGLLSWVNRLLASDENNFVSVISVRDLRRALLAFQKEVLVQGLEGEVARGYLAAGSRSRFGGSPPATQCTKSTIKSRTRNYKS